MKHKIIRNILVSLGLSLVLAVSISVLSPVQAGIHNGFSSGGKWNSNENPHCGSGCRSWNPTSGLSGEALNNFLANNPAANSYYNEMSRQVADLKNQLASLGLQLTPGSCSGSTDRKSTRLNSSHIQKSRMPSSA